MDAISRLSLGFFLFFPSFFVGKSCRDCLACWRPSYTATSTLLIDLIICTCGQLIITRDTYFVCTWSIQWNASHRWHSISFLTSLCWFSRVLLANQKSRKCGKRSCQSSHVPFNYSTRADVWLVEMFRKPTERFGEKMSESYQIFTEWQGYIAFPCKTKRNDSAKTAFVLGRCSCIFRLAFTYY